jgi:hypothetical protein
VEETNERSPVLGGTKSKTWETTVDRVDSWPEEARPLKKHTWISFVYTTGDVLLVMLPIYFVCAYPWVASKLIIIDSLKYLELRQQSCITNLHKTTALDQKSNLP